METQNPRLCNYVYLILVYEVCHIVYHISNRMSDLNRGQRTEDKGQRTEDKGQRTEWEMVNFRTSCRYLYL